MIVTKASLKQLLERNPEKVIGRALVALLANQTESEKVDNMTKVLNGIGFTGADARSGTLTAKYFIKHGTLADWMVERWMKVERSGWPRLCKYAKQLNEIAEQRAQNR